MDKRKRNENNEEKPNEVQWEEDFETILIFNNPNGIIEEWLITYFLEGIGVKPFGMCVGFNKEFYIEFESLEDIEKVKELNGYNFGNYLISISPIPLTIPPEIKLLLKNLKDRSAYERFLNELKESEVGMGIRNIVDEWFGIYGPSTIQWAFRAIAFKSLSKDHLVFLSKVLMTEDFTTIALNHFSFLQTQLLEVKLTQPVSLSNDLHSLFFSLHQLIEEYLSSTFILSSPLYSIINRLKRMVSLTYIPSFLSSINIPEELTIFAMTPLAAFLDDKSLDELRQFLVTVLQFPDAQEKVKDIPSFLTQEILPLETQQRIIAFNLIKKLNVSTQQSVKEVTANLVVEHGILADCGQVAMAEYLYDIGCYVHSAVLAVHSLNKRQENNIQAKAIISESIRQVKHIPNMAMVIVKEIMSSGVNKDQIIQYLVEDDTIDVALGFRGIDLSIEKYASKLLWKVRILQGNYSEAVKEVIRFAFSENDVFERLTEIRNCLGSVGNIGEIGRNELIKTNDVLQCQWMVLQSLEELRICILQKSNMECQPVNDDFMNSIQNTIETVRRSVLDLNKLSAIAGQYKLYDDLLVIYLHSTTKEPQIIQKLWKIVQFMLFREENKNNRLIYFDKLRLKLGRFQSEIPQNLLNELERCYED